MVVEEPKFYMAVKKDFSKGIVVCSEFEPTWKSIVSERGVTDSGGAFGTMTRRCALRMFNTRVNDHNLTKRLLWVYV